MVNENNVIIVDGNIITTEIKEMNIFDLKYWHENPRIDSIIKQKFPTGGVTEDNLEQELWALDSVKDLYQDIKQNKGLIDEILVKGNQVLEGNSRLCAYKQLHKKATTDDEKEKWAKIRARIISDNISDEAIFTILGTWHIKGKAEWRKFEKAAYIYRLHKDYGKNPKQIAIMVKQSETDVRNIIETYKTMIEKGITETKEQKKFSTVFEIIKNPEMKKVKKENPLLFDKCIEAVKDDKFERGEQVRDLPKIIQDKKAKKAFFEAGESFQDALDIAKSRHPEFEDIFYNQIKKTTTILQDCSVERIEEIKIDGHKKHIVENFYKEVKNFCKKVGIIN
jgi:hypothetical protein